MARRRRAIESDAQERELVETTQDENQHETTFVRPDGSISLASVRNEVLRHRTEMSHTIADLEAWKAEIECTLAFLRAKV
jgi:hypothetical protein